VRFWVGVTDNDWFRFLRERPMLEEVNFWQPSGGWFGAVPVGAPFLFKLHYPENYIVGGGYLAHVSVVGHRTAWEWFGEKNGVRTLEEMRRRIGKYRRQPISPFEEAQIGCVMLSEPFEDDLRSWDLAELWELLRRREVRVGLRTQHFVADWLGIVRDLPCWVDLPEQPRARRLISDRELLLKKNRARLHSRRHLELWGGASGTQPLDYRWPKVQRMLGEILALA
jgi:hypothetical protein